MEILFLQILLLAGMTLFIKTKFKKSDDQTNIDKRRKFEIERIILKCIKQLFHPKNVCKKN